MLKLNQMGYYDLNVQESCFQSDVYEFTLETLFKLGKNSFLFLINFFIIIIKQRLLLLYRVV